jgi:hypothetical protein
MTDQLVSGGKGLRVYPPPPKDFDPFTASAVDLRRHGLPLRPDPRVQPGLAALWERLAARYRGFEHLEPRLEPATAAGEAATPTAISGVDPRYSCAYGLTSTTAAPFTALFVTRTVPDLRFSAVPNGPSVNYFHTFASLGFLDVHVEMTVDSANHVTAQLTAANVASVNLPVSPGDVISTSLCLQANAAGTASYFFANETTAQTLNFTFDTGYPPAVTISAGVTRTGNQAIQPLASFGSVYFDEISAYTTSGPRSLTAGEAITMADENGVTLARPEPLNDYAFKAVFAAA